MKRILFGIGVFIVVALFFSGWVLAAGDFNFVFTRNDVTLDTEHETLEFYQGNGVSGVIRLSLSKKELAQLSKKFDQIDYWSDVKYPKEFGIPSTALLPSAEGKIVRHMNLSGPQFKFHVVRGNKTKDLVWDDSTTGVKYPPAERLKEVINLIHKFVTSKPEFKESPKFRVLFRP